MNCCLLTHCDHALTVLAASREPVRTQQSPTRLGESGNTQAAHVRLLPKRTTQSWCS